MLDEAGFAYVKSPHRSGPFIALLPENPAFVDAAARWRRKTVGSAIIEADENYEMRFRPKPKEVSSRFCRNGQPVEYARRLFKVKLS